MTEIPGEFPLPEEAAQRQRSLLGAHIEGGRRSARITRRGLVAVAVVILVGGLLVTPALGIGSRLLDLIESPHGLPGVRSPVWSPGGGRIAFLSRGERSKGVYVVNADGSGQRRLTGDARFPAAPAWSPNGRQIAFEGGSGAPSSVYVVNADGSGQRRLARNGRAPAWSPDGRTIAFFSDSKMYLMNADGSEHRQLTKTHWAGGGLAWSPDGRKLAFFDQGGPCPWCFILNVVNSDGSGLRNLTPKLWAAGAGSGPTFDPAWSPDGQMIAFVGRVGLTAGPVTGLGEPIYVVRADGSGLRNLTPKPVGTYAAPTWSPDGRKLAFVSDREGNSDVYVMNADGSGQRSLTRNPAYDADPAWSHDGRIAFVSIRDGNYGVYVLNADGGGPRRLAQHSP